MYICNECGVLFDEPARYGEIHHELDNKAIEYFSCCPNCGDTFFEEALRCDYCGNEFRDEDMVEGLICKDCLEDIIGGRQDIVEAFIMENKEAFAEFVHDHKDMNQEAKND